MALLESRGTGRDISATGRHRKAASRRICWKSPGRWNIPSSS